MEELDGNGAAGKLSEVFALEMTGARGRCDGCGNVGALAEARAFLDAPGVVIRCRALRVGVARARARRRPLLARSERDDLARARAERRGARAPRRSNVYAGLMFWFTWKTFSGSYFALISASRA